MPLARRENSQGIIFHPRVRPGPAPNPYQAGLLQFIGVTETRQEALRLYREPAEYCYERCRNIDPRFTDPPGFTSEATLRAKVQSQVARAADRTTIKGMAHTWEAILDEGYVIVGSPDEVAERLRQVATDLNVGHLMFQGPRAIAGWWRSNASPSPSYPPFLPGKERKRTAIRGQPLVGAPSL